MQLIGARRTLIHKKRVVASGGGALTFTWTDSGFASGTPAPPQSFTTKAIGTSSADRYVVVTIANNGSSSANKDITSVTVDPNASGSPVSLTRLSEAGAGASGKSVQTWGGLVTGAGTTATIKIDGYVNGFVGSITFSVGVIKGSAAISLASSVTTKAYPSGSGGQAITVPTNGVTVISAYSDNDAPTTGVVSSFTNATLDKDQSDGAAFGQTGTMAHLTVSATVTMTSTTSSAFGWIASNFQP